MKNSNEIISKLVANMVGHTVRKNSKMRRDRLRDELMGVGDVQTFQAVGTSLACVQMGDSSVEKGQKRNEAPYPSPAPPTSG